MSNFDFYRINTVVDAEDFADAQKDPKVKSFLKESIEYGDSKRISFARENYLWHELSGDILDNLNDPKKIKSLIYDLYKKLGVLHGE